MAFYRNDIGRVQQVVRVVLGAAVAVLGLFMLPGLWSWLAAASGIGMALTGFIGWRPACAVTGIGIGKGKDHQFGRNPHETFEAAQRGDQALTGTGNYRHRP